MSVSISNTGAPQAVPVATAAADSTKNAEPLAVRGDFNFIIQDINRFVSFLVMRLSKPTLYQNIPVYAEEESSSSAAAFVAGQSHDIAIGNDNSVLSQLLVLPYSFGLVCTFLAIDLFFPSSGLRFDLGMYFWVRYFLLSFHCTIKVIKYFTMLFLK